MYVICSEKEHLTQEFVQVAVRRNELCAAQLAAILNGEDFPFEEEIEHLTVDRREARIALQQHLRHHGCLR